ncbi:hypothetical protein [Haladaptatus cibarius]|uniref:hypothetical protein n=1 Tax=Haladaptatus cibarius TaxID=453847 RepID=UPI000678D777|nr:hypothetical protein [Haladaptatus cibarius]
MSIPQVGEISMKVEAQTEWKLRKFIASLSDDGSTHASYTLDLTPSQCIALLIDYVDEDELTAEYGEITTMQETANELESEWMTNHLDDERENGGVL